MCRAGCRRGRPSSEGPRDGAPSSRQKADLAGDAGGPFRPPSRSRGLLLGHVAFPWGALLSGRHRGRARPTEADGLGLRAGRAPRAGSWTPGLQSPRTTHEDGPRSPKPGPAGTGSREKQDLNDEKERAAQGK